jgi:hypothetical protein
LEREPPGILVSPDGAPPVPVSRPPAPKPRAPAKTLILEDAPALPAGATAPPDTDELLDDEEMEREPETQRRGGKRQRASTLKLSPNELPIRPTMARGRAPSGPVSVEVVEAVLSDEATSDVHDQLDQLDQLDLSGDSTDELPPSVDEDPDLTTELGPALEVDDGDDEPPPAAVRPLGRLAGDGFGLTLDYPREEPKDVEADKLESWLGAVVAQPATARGIAPTVAHPGVFTESESPPESAAPETAAPETGPAQSFAQADQLDAWLAAHAQGPSPSTPSNPVSSGADRGVDPASIKRKPARTMPPATAHGLGIPFALPAAGALPFQPAASEEAARALEAWVDDCLRAESLDAIAPPPEDARVPTSRHPVLPARANEVLVASDAPAVIRPNPLAGSAAPVVVVEDEAAVVSEPEPELVGLADYALVKIRVWDDGVSLLSALEEAGIDESLWREHELRQATALAAELREDKTVLAQRLRAAIRIAREEQADADEAWNALMPLGEYASIRVALEGIDDELHQRQLLLERGLSPDAWQEQRTSWAKRARLEKDTRKRLRRAVAAARRAASAMGGPAPEQAAVETGQTSQRPTSEPAPSQAPTSERPEEDELAPQGQVSSSGTS